MVHGLDGAERYSMEQVSGVKWGRRSRLQWAPVRACFHGSDLAMADELRQPVDTDALSVDRR